MAWLLWVASALTALPPAVLSLTLHVLRVWRPQPAVSDTTAPLVTSAEGADDLPDAPPHAPVVSASSAVPSLRPIWPPRQQPSSGASITTSDVRSAATVAAAVHTGDASSIGVSDVAAACRVAAAAAPVAAAFSGPPVWPPRVD
jgi:hypothetical protein